MGTWDERPAGFASDDDRWPWPDPVRWRPRLAGWLRRVADFVDPGPVRS